MTGGEMSEQVTIYCVQPFWWNGRQLARAEPSQFRTLDEAQRAAKLAYERHAGVAILSITGSPEFDAWNAPQQVGAIGNVLVVE